MDATGETLASRDDVGERDDVVGGVGHAREYGTPSLARGGRRLACLRKR